MILYDDDISHFFDASHPMLWKLPCKNTRLGIKISIFKKMKFQNTT